MSKLKVPLNYAMKLLLRPHKAKLKQLYLFSLVKSAKLYSLFKDDNRDQNIIKKVRFPDIMQEADKLYEAHQYLAIYELLDRVKLAKDPNILWRIARALYNLSYNENNSKDIKIKMINEAKSVLQMAFSFGGSENAEVHKWMAIILDEHYGLLNLENRVKYSTLVKYHLEKACELNPQDYTTQYMLGNWYYQMSQLTWFQRLIAKYFLASEPPKCDIKQAYKYLSHAEELQPRTMLSNLYLLGSTCNQIGYYFKAKYYLNLAVSLKPQNESERFCSIKAQNLLRKLDTYNLANVLFYDPIGFNE